MMFHYHQSCTLGIFTQKQAFDCRRKRFFSALTRAPEKGDGELTLKYLGRCKEVDDTRWRKKLKLNEKPYICQRQWSRDCRELVYFIHTPWLTQLTQLRVFMLLCILMELFINYYPQITVFSFLVIFTILLHGGDLSRDSESPLEDI